jgi:isopenicillin N synthase-like dioxygenase
VPVVDVGADLAVVDRGVAAAAAEFGMVRVVGHGLGALSDALVEQARAALRLIDGNDSVRDAVRAVPEEGRFAGYSPPAREALAAAEGDLSTPPDLRRTWTWATDEPAPWAPLPPGFQVAAWRWSLAAVELLSARVRPGLSVLLGVDLAEVYGRPRGVCRVNDYPPVEAAPLPGQMRAGAHRDYGPFTLVVPDGPGLQLSYRDRWLDVPYDPAEVIVNVGDELRALAALVGRPGVVAPALHRVIAPPAGSPGRASLVCFWFGQPGTVVDRDRDGSPVTSAEFVQRRVLAQVGAS